MKISEEPVLRLLTAGYCKPVPPTLGPPPYFVQRQQVLCQINSRRTKRRSRSENVQGKCPYSSNHVGTTSQTAVDTRILPSRSWSLDSLLSTFSRKPWSSSTCRSPFLFAAAFYFNQVNITLFRLNSLLSLS